MNRPFLLFVVSLALLAVPARAQSTNPAPSTDTNTVSAPSGPMVETLVIIRHGEKTHGELGQLSVKGLNRSLALPKVLLGKYGRPDDIFAPDPAEEIPNKDKVPFCYVRPFATIEPTAIYLGMPVNTLFGFRDIRKMEDELDKPSYQNALVFIAWEHVNAENFARDEMVNHGGDGARVPNWAGKDFDSIYVVKISRDGGETSAVFTLDKEGLDGLSGTFPGPIPALPPAN